MYDKVSIMHGRAFQCVVRHPMATYPNVSQDILMYGKASQDNVKGIPMYGKAS